MAKKGKGKKTSTTVTVPVKRARPTNDYKGGIDYANSQSELEHTVALSNPFSSAARGAKIPDDDGTKSFALQLRGLFHIDSDANGHSVFVIRPNIGNVFVPGTVHASNGTVTAWGAATAWPDTTAVQAAVDKSRIVSFGVRVYSSLAPLNQSGEFRMITTPENPALAAPFTYNSCFFEEVKSYPTTETSVHWISKPIGVTWKEYANSLAADAPWEYLTVVGTGLPASAVHALTCEVVMNLECQPNLGSITATHATDAAPHKPHVLTAANEVLKKHGGSSVGKVGSAIFSLAARAALNFLSRRVIGTPLFPARIKDQGYMMVD